MLLLQLMLLLLWLLLLPLPMMHAGPVAAMFLLHSEAAVAA